MDRICSRCGCSDRPVGGGYDNDGKLTYEHFVKPDVVYMNGRNTVTQKEASQGWTYLFFQSQHAMMRMTCEDCINAGSERDEVWSILKDHAKTLEDKGKDPTYYNIVCGE